MVVQMVKQKNQQNDSEVMVEKILESEEYERLEQTLLQMVRHAFLAGYNISSQMPDLQEARP